MKRLIVQNSKVKVSYSGALFQANAENVFIHYGFDNDWKELNEIAMYNKKEIYNILFKATSESILELCEDTKWLGGKVGITSILHTWGQTMEFHPHIHSIVTGGGIKNNKWIQTDKNYLIKVQVLSSLFKEKFLSMLKRLDLKLPKHLKHLKDYKNLNNFLRPLYKKEWITYIEPPKGSP